MVITDLIFICYFVIGVFLAVIWWNDEYKAEYEYAKSCGEVEEPMAVILIMALIFLWPIKLLKNSIDI